MQFHRVRKKPTSRGVLSLYRGGCGACVARRAQASCFWTASGRTARFWTHCAVVVTWGASIKERFLAAGLELALAKPDVGWVVPFWKLAVVDCVGTKMGSYRGRGWPR